MKKVVPLPIPHRIHRGDPVSTIQTYTFPSGAIVNICDDFVVKTEEEREEVDRDIAAAAWAIIEELEEMGEAV